MKNEIYIVSCLIGLAVFLSLAGIHHNLQAQREKSFSKISNSERALDQSIREEDERAPKIAWVLAYPCTGSDFVIDVIQKLTSRNTATNYGHLVEEASGILSRKVYESTPLFIERINGPYLFTYHLPLPVKTFIPTLSYCGGYCAHCYPGKYVLTRDKFLEKCLTGTKFTPSKYNNGENGYGFLEEVQYTSELVKKAGVIIRNPIDVISTRFMYYSNSYAVKLDWTQRYDQSRDGFLAFCEESKVKYAEEDSLHYPEGFYEAGKDLPCYAEIFKVIQWHNLVCETLEHMQLKSQLFYYEDFFAKYDETARDLLDFYGMAHVIPIAGTRPDQVRLTQDFYTPEEADKVKDYIRFMATGCTKQVLSRYGI